MSLRHVIVGDGDLAGGVLEHYYYDKAGDRFVLSFSTATSPTQIYTVEAKDRLTIVMHTEERILGIPESQLSQGEDASFVSFDGTRVSARLYLPAEFAWLHRAAPAGLLHPRRAAGPGAPGFCLVLDAAHPVPDPARLRRLRAERARFHRLWPGLYQAGRPGLGRAGSP